MDAKSDRHRQTWADRRAAEARRAELRHSLREMYIRVEDATDDEFWVTQHPDGSRTPGLRDSKGERE